MKTTMPECQSTLSTRPLSGFTSHATRLPTIKLEFMKTQLTLAAEFALLATLSLAPSLAPAQQSPAATVSTSWHLEASADFLAVRPGDECLLLAISVFGDLNQQGQNGKSATVERIGV